MSCLQFDEAITAMTLKGSSFSQEYVFYLYMIAQCRVIFDEDLPAAAAVNFEYDHFNLFINPKELIREGKTKNLPILGFGKLPLAHRIGILKHEMLHIIYKFNLRALLLQQKYGDDYSHKIDNMASDCALNQDINPQHLPGYVVTPVNLQKYMDITVPPNLTTEHYYELLNKSKSKFNGDEPLEILDDHDKWEEIKGDPMIAQAIVKSMVEKAMVNTQKSMGSIPSSYGSWLELLTNKHQLNWKQLLRRVVGNKKANVRSTIYKPNRRNPDAMHLKGKTKDYVFDLLVVTDVSGSVSDKELLYGLTEIKQICKTTASSVKLIQVDSVAYPPEDIKKNLISFNRKACGGTVLAPAIDMAKEHDLNFNAVVVITDGHIDRSDIVAYEALNKRVIWVITSSEDIEKFNSNKMTGCALSMD